MGIRIKWSCNLLCDHKRAAGAGCVPSQVHLSKLSSLFLFQKKFSYELRGSLLISFSLLKKKHAAYKKAWCVLMSFLPSKYYPSLALCCAGFSKSCRNRWPWLCSRKQGMERDWITGLTGAGKKESPQDNQLLHPSPNITNHPVSWEISLWQSLWVTIPNSSTC